jgi:putative membrane protein
VKHRRPKWVYGEGDEPDPRFSFANERTFLAWIRTALALMAGGLALQAFPLSIPAPAREGLALVLVCLAIVCAVAGWVRWARSEHAMRNDAPLPALSVGVFVATVVATIGVVLIVGLARG